jgi:hypothetical protein
VVGGRAMGACQSSIARLLCACFDRFSLCRAVHLPRLPRHTQVHNAPVSRRWSAGACRVSGAGSARCGVSLERVCQAQRRMLHRGTKGRQVIF